VVPLSSSRPKMDQKQMVSHQAASVSFYFTIAPSPLADLSIFIELT
jgi:hypothetical protein